MAFIILCLATLLQGLIPILIPEGSGVPLLYGVIVFCALAMEWGELVVVLILAGSLRDSMGASPFGVSIFAFLVTGLLINRFKYRLFARSILTQILVGGIGSAFFGLLFGILCWAVGVRSFADFNLLARLGERFLAGAILVPLVFFCLTPFKRFLVVKEGRFL